MYKNKILFVDFDNTLTHKSQYPITGKLNKSVVEYVKKLSKHNTLILWTCRTGDDLKEAITLCENENIYFQGYNEFNGIKYIKPMCDFFIDDKNIKNSFLFKLKCLLYYSFVKIKKWIKESIELFNEVEKFRVEHNLPDSTDCNFYGFSEIK